LLEAEGFNRNGGKMQQVLVHKGRTVIVPVSLGMNVSNDIITSEIREEKSSSSTLIATWDVSFDTDGTDGEIVLTLDDEITEGITQTIGYMDLKRVSGEEPLNILAEPLEVLFVEVITE
jgi:hypothetical protein